MNKKILGATVTALFCVCLIVSSNIQEGDAERTQTDTEMYSGEHSKAEENDAVAAGVCLVLSQNSFTTESDQETIIEKNEIRIVAAPEETTESSEEASAGQTEEDDEEASAGQTEEDDEEASAGQAEEEEDAGQQIYTNRWGITLTEEEIDLLAKIVWLEAGGEPELGQQAVVEVVFNRMASDEYPNTLYDVLSQKDPVQFCSWKNREIAEPTEKEYQSIYQVLYGNTNILRNDTLYFSTEGLTPNLDQRIGGHSFCY